MEDLRCECAPKENPNSSNIEIDTKIRILYSVPLAYPCFKNSVGFKESTRSRACYRLLVLAGADPLISYQGEWTANALSKVLQYGTAVSRVTPFHSNNSYKLSGRT